jgi:hypothetical protein
VRIEIKDKYLFLEKGDKTSVKFSLGKIRIGQNPV